MRQLVHQFQIVHVFQEVVQAFVFLIILKENGGKKKKITG